MDSYIVMEMSYSMVTWCRDFFNLIELLLYLNWVHFIMCKLCLDRVDFLKMQRLDLMIDQVFDISKFPYLYFFNIQTLQVPQRTLFRFLSSLQYPHLSSLSSFPFLFFSTFIEDLIQFYSFKYRLYATNS